VTAQLGDDRPRILCVFAHPDDETLACGGTIALCARAGAEVTIYSATPGQAGHGKPSSSPAEREALAAVRRDELRAAASRLGAARVEVGLFLDGFLPYTEAATIDAQLEHLVDETAPHAVITFGQDGLYWHPDHIAIGARTAAVVRRSRHRPALYYVLIAPGVMSALVNALRARAPEVAETLWGVAPRAFGLHAAAATLTVDVREAMDAKLEALRCHRSQFPSDHPLAHLNATLGREFLGDEWFRHDATSAGPPDLLLKLARGRLAGRANRM
jgi:LmbE family N-acetylglucosaminyl deacetylase